MDVLKKHADVKVLTIWIITVREAGKELTDFAALKEPGAFAFTDDGVGVQVCRHDVEAMKDAAKVGYANCRTL